ncbi:MAG TPA: heme-binding domain-containing protein, partial [Ignavibacteria bacterium]
VWPWYTNIAPASWLVAQDVRNGRAKMNFSEWGKIPESKQEARLEAICDKITEGEMPLPKYLIFHGDAVLTQQDKDALCKWTEDELKKRENEE